MAHFSNYSDEELIGSIACASGVEQQAMIAEMHRREHIKTQGRITNVHEEVAKVQPVLSAVCDELKPLRSLESDSASVRKMTKWILGLTAATFLVVLADQVWKFYSATDRSEKQQIPAAQKAGISQPPDPLQPSIQLPQKSAAPAGPTQTPTP